MKEYFQKQLDDRAPLTEEKMVQMRNKPYCGSWNIGDKVLFFLEYEYAYAIEEKTLTDHNNKILPLSLFPAMGNSMAPSHGYTVRLCSDRDMDILETKFKFKEIAAGAGLPVLERK